MRRELAGGYELDDDRERIDLVAVHEVLTESYWAIGRSLETVRLLVRSAARVVGLYLEGRQVGFCRVESDGQTFAFLFDVYVVPEHRGRGLGVELVREAVDHGPHRDLRWFLKTRDAHGLYERFGFGPPDAERTMERGPRPVSPG
jgi:GNAT superfamily N-acetyltransferase